MLGLSYVSLAGNPDKEKRSSKTVCGRITDAQGESIAGAKIFVEETGESFYSDLEGRFRISLGTDKEYSVTINTIGYEPLEVKASRLSPFTDLSLKEL